ncbi:hypothetical protein [Kangiella sp.]
MVFDVYDRCQQQFFSNERRNQLSQQLNWRLYPLYSQEKQPQKSEATAE